MSQDAGDIIKKKQPFTAAQLLLWGGFGIAFLGAVFFVAQYFDDWLEAGELLVSLGIGLSFTYLGVRLEQTKPGASNVTLWLVFGLPSLFAGIGLLAKMIWGYNGPVGIMILNLIFTGIALVIYAVQKRNVALFIALLVGSAAYFRVLDVVLSNAYHEDTTYRSLVLGVCWGAFATVFSNTKREPLVNFMWSVAGALVFFSMLWLAEKDGNVGIMWEVAGVALSSLLFFGSPKFGRSAFLWIGGFALLCNILGITYRHFYESLNWPILLMITGLAISTVGYLMIRMRGEYFSKK